MENILNRSIHLPKRNYANSNLSWAIKSYNQAKRQHQRLFRKQQDNAKKLKQLDKIIHGFEIIISEGDN